jgi:hypothetical protein
MPAGPVRLHPSLTLLQQAQHQVLLGWHAEGSQVQPETTGMMLLKSFD